ncbi:MAG: bifunctional pyr operon transcriptional regulator/uracil phosphoribosyltransferase PyrR [bacterium]
MKVLLDSTSFERTLKRLSHEIIEKNENINDLVFIGIKRKGVPICEKVASNLKTMENINVPIETIDISGYRDDKKEVNNVNSFSVDITGKTIILFDDVLQSGRTVRSALDALVDIGRPKKIQLAVLVDRGHRELPIRADFIGKNIPTSSKEIIVYNPELNEVVIK